MEEKISLLTVNLVKKVMACIANCQAQLSDHQNRKKRPMRGRISGQNGQQKKERVGLQLGLKGMGKLTTGGYGGGNGKNLAQSHFDRGMGNRSLPNWVKDPGGN